MNIVDFLLILVFAFPLILAMLTRFNIKRIRREIKEVGKYFSLFLAMLITFYIVNNSSILDKIMSILVVEFGDIIEKTTSIPYIALIITFILLTICFYFIIKQLFKIIDYLTIKPIIIKLNKSQSKIGIVYKKIIAIIFEIPKSILYVFILALIFNVLYKSDIVGSKLDSYIANSKSYNLIEKVDLPSIVLKEDELYPANDESIATVSNNKNKLAVINLYNGVTLEEGIKSNKSIKEFAQSLVKESDTDKEKAKKIYNWIGENIEYDDEKAKLVEEQYKDLKSGAITSFETKKGVCFDYSCLYVAMCRAVGLKVKLIAGSAFNGKQWGPHAWNEVYISEKNEWINVDSTFYNEKNSFGGKNFNETHKAENIIGEWK